MQSSDPLVSEAVAEKATVKALSAMQDHIFNNFCVVYRSTQ